MNPSTILAEVHHAQGCPRCDRRRPDVASRATLRVFYILAIHRSTGTHPATIRRSCAAHPRSCLRSTADPATKLVFGALCTAVGLMPCREPIVRDRLKIAASALACSTLDRDRRHARNPARWRMVAADRSDDRGDCDAALEPAGTDRQASDALRDAVRTDCVGDGRSLSRCGRTARTVAHRDALTLEMSDENRPGTQACRHRRAGA